MFIGVFVIPFLKQRVRIVRQALGGEQGSHGAAGGWKLGLVRVLLHVLEVGEGRGNRPQLRCGIVLQTPTSSANDGGRANRVGNPVKAGARKRALREFQI